MPLAIADTLKDRYRIDQLLGRGGFGAVYRAWDLNLEEPVAVKESFETSDAAHKQFQLEAKLLFKLRHAGLPRVHDFFVIPQQGMYLVMDYIEGDDLNIRLVQAGGALPESQTLLWITQVCQALEYLHSQDPPIIHRDIKPANIRVTPGGQAILVDFGIAKVYDPESRTSLGARAVTPGYSPPEQYGQRPTDARSDVYALGATLYHLLSGQRPPESIDRLSGAAVTPLWKLNPAVSPSIEAKIKRAMAMLPDERYQSVGEFRRMLERTADPVSVGLAASRSQAALRGLVTNPPVAAPALPGRSAGVAPGRIAVPARKPAWGASWKWLAAGAGVLLFGFLVAWLILSGSPTAAVNQLLGAAPAGMALVPAGEFLMGSPDSDALAAPDELPQHRVYLDAFYIDRTEITNRRYAECVAAGYCLPPKDNSSWSQASYYNNPAFADYPVIKVDWYQAENYCKWRGGQLPTEAQWEKAARGADGRFFPWGNAFDSKKLNFCDRNCEFVWAEAEADDGFGDTAPVGSYPAGASPYGLLDMAGNVWEWVQDWYFIDYYLLQGAWMNPTGPPAGQARVLRGGSWYSYGIDARTALRYGEIPAGVYSSVGFRCVLLP